MDCLNGAQALRLAVAFLSQEQGSVTIVCDNEVCLVVHTKGLGLL